MQFQKPRGEFVDLIEREKHFSNVYQHTFKKTNKKNVELNAISLNKF